MLHYWWHSAPNLWTKKYEFSGTLKLIDIIAPNTCWQITPDTFGVYKKIFNSTLLIITTVHCHCSSRLNKLIYLQNLNFWRELCDWLPILTFEQIYFGFVRKCCQFADGLWGAKSENYFFWFQDFNFSEFRIIYCEITIKNPEIRIF